ncbi:MAG: peptidylprolyl isomerase [Desulfococcaceae bacterium]|nr:peptidylprolyl isomerase [Desulfococcaceae bacterium]
MTKMIRICTPVLLMLLFVCMGITDGISAEVRQKKFSPEEIAAMKDTQALIRTKFGDMTIRFFPEVAPGHVDNFIALARRGFYNGTTFHRVIPGFMIQGGDPNSRNPDRGTHGTGGPGYNLKAEFNKKPHKKGILSMARSGHPDSAGSQFFICVADVPHLDGKYTVFGEVVSGMEVADQIASQKKDGRDNPLEKIEMQVEIVSVPKNPEQKTEKP